MVRLRVLSRDTSGNMRGMSVSIYEVLDELRGQPTWEADEGAN